MQDLQTLKPNMAIRLNDAKLVMRDLFLAIMKIAKVYQIPNFDNTNAELLAEWILEEYQHHDLELVQTALRNPPRLNDQAWRLTPDTLREWIELTRIKRANLKDAEESKKRQELEVVKNDISPETQKLIKETLNNLLDGPKNVMTLSPDEIKEEGQTRPKAFKHPSTDAGYVKEWAERVKRHAEQTYRERHPNATDEEVKRFLKTI